MQGEPRCADTHPANVLIHFQHGKDFEAIQNNIALKYKKKGKPASMVKNKEQVRHFYYRTWHKITKYIDFGNGEACSGRAAEGPAARGGQRRGRLPPERPAEPVPPAAVQWFAWRRERAVLQLSCPCSPEACLL